VFNRTGLRVALGLVFAMSALGAMAAPAAAEVVVKACVGNCGYYEVYDNSTGQPGAKCTYQNSYPYKLLNVNVRPPLMHGDYSNKTKVGWRFLIQRKNINGNKWLVYYTSSYQTATASDSIPAYVGSGFSRRKWNAPNNPSGYQYRVVLELRWWHNGSVEGYAKVRYTYLLQQRANGMNGNLGSYCIPNN
jgi:hypothetical protein